MAKSKAAKKTVFRPRPGAHVSKSDAQVVGSFCLELETKHGALTAALFVREAKKHPRVRSLLTWDDTKAAAQWRLREARLLMGCFTVEVIREDKTVDVRGMSFVASSGGYVSTATVSNNSDLATELLRRAEADLRNWYLRYQKLRNAFGERLDPVFDAIEAAQLAAEGKAV